MICAIVGCCGLCQAIPVDHNGMAKVTLCCGCDRSDHNMLASGGGIVAFVLFILLFFAPGTIFIFIFFLVVAVVGCVGCCSTEQNPYGLGPGTSPALLSQQQPHMASQTQQPAFAATAVAVQQPQAATVVVVSNPNP